MNYRRIPFMQRAGAHSREGLQGLEGKSMATKVTYQVDKSAAPGWRGFMTWLAREHPDVYNLTRATAPSAVTMIEQSRMAGTPVAGLGDTATPQSSILSNLVTTITQAGAAILPLIAQKKILDVQIARAQAGQQPLDTSKIVDPNQGLNVGLNPSTQKTMLYLGGGLLLTVVAIAALRPRGRR